MDSRKIVLVDDEIDTGSTIIEAVHLSKQYGAKDIFVACVHPVLSLNAAQRLSEAPIKELITTNTIPIPQEAQTLFEDRLTILPIAPMVAEVIRRANQGRSVGAMFNE